MFKELFGKKKKENVSNGKFSADLKDKIESSTLEIMTHDLFKHYWSANLVENLSDPEWQNQAIYFWHYKEPFEKQSLPPYFSEFQQKTFIINDLPQTVSVSGGQVMPWFGMPGGGTKYFFQMNDGQIQIRDLVNNGCLSYVEIVKLTDSNSNILTQRGNCFFLMDTNVIQFENGKFYHNNKEIALSEAVEKGEIILIKMDK